MVPYEIVIYEELKRDLRSLLYIRSKNTLSNGLCISVMYVYIVIKHLTRLLVDNSCLVRNETVKSVYETFKFKSMKFPFYLDFPSENLK